MPVEPRQATNDMMTLSPLVVQQVKCLFAENDQAEVSRLLNETCGKQTFYRKMDWSELSERVQCAVLKLSNGDMDRFNQALDLFKDNWNNLLIEAGFGHDPNAHIKWVEE